MWKIALGFVVFAAISLYVIMQAGDKVDMSGEKHGADAVHVPDALGQRVGLVPVLPHTPQQPARQTAA